MHHFSPILYYRNPETGLLYIELIPSETKHLQLSERQNFNIRTFIEGVYNKKEALGDIVLLCLEITKTTANGNIIICWNFKRWPLETTLTPDNQCTISLFNEHNQVILKDFKIEEHSYFDQGVTALEVAKNSRRDALGCLKRLRSGRNY